MEQGHTTWNTPPDTPNPSLLQLDAPVVDGVSTVPLAWYTHLSKVPYQVPDGGPRRRMKAGEVLGYTGLGRGVAHLHFGFLVDRRPRDEHDWMAPARVADLVWPDANGRTQNPDPHAPPIDRYVKAFWHDGAGTLTVDGREYPVHGIKVNDQPFAGGSLLIGY